MLISSSHDRRPACSQSVSLAAQNSSTSSGVLSVRAASAVGFAGHLLMPPTEHIAG
jgi:hypothetical protein